MKIHHIVALIALFGSASSTDEQNTSSLRKRELAQTIDVQTQAFLGSRNFDVNIDCIGEDLLFRSVKQIESQVSVVQFMGLSNVNQKRPGDISNGDLILTKRAEKNNNALYQWYMEYVMNHNFSPCTINIDVFEDGPFHPRSDTPVLALTFREAFPISYGVSDLGKDIARPNPLLEEIKVAYEHLQIRFPPRTPETP
mmetsp:Transcript_48702/g.72726  ORF Transcript_48702/g.72726 Transcript_48702/m.72726 type:complete len:197 (-) Transcript_48702:143-733(-)|eukprot:CAMPEP_0194032966 /NCGR_PEP_ID=MMETSP0009_2-20130614/5795_1 /TAXON_ID=210454 /ORGANISM="Grammatophora oceanica, Strain CCMP 410" /LENGTH=196 /DNA_ID=CAMNT_0038673561 /DNA_START=60 /DNA_END=650 /DNA_ORIENTATION=-